MKTEDIDKRIGMPDVDAEWARFEREVIGSADVSSATVCAEVSSANGNPGIHAPRRRTIYAWIGGLAIAASVLLLFVLNFGKEVTEETALTAQNTTVQSKPSERTEVQSLPSPVTISDADEKSQTTQVPDETVQKPNASNKKPQSLNEVPTPPIEENVETATEAQQGNGEAAHEPQPSTEPVIKVYSSVEQSASFPGGDRACMEFINENLRVPELATAYGVKARVITTFLVGKTGELSDAKVVKSFVTCDSTLISQLSEAERAQLKEQLTQQLSDEAVRIVSIMPRWRPCKINGEVREQKYTIPIRFNQETNH